MENLMRVLLIASFLLTASLSYAQVLVDRDEFTGSIEISMEKPISIPFENRSGHVKFSAGYWNQDPSTHKKFRISIISSFSFVDSGTAYFLIDGKRAQFSIFGQSNFQDEYSQVERMKYLNFKRSKREQEKRYPYLEAGEKLYICKLTKEEFQKIAISEVARFKIGDNVFEVTSDARNALKDIYEKYEGIK